MHMGISGISTISTTTSRTCPDVVEHPGASSGASQWDIPKANSALMCMVLELERFTTVDPAAKGGSGRAV